MALKLARIAVPKRLFSTESIKTKIGIVGIPYNRGNPKRNGTELAPNVIRQSDSFKEIKEFNENVDIKDFGDVAVNNIEQELESIPKNMLNYAGLLPTMKSVSEKIQDVRAENRICITLGGDHTIVIGLYIPIILSTQMISKVPD